ncbi:MAG: hypothetical protein K8H86_06165, partial [Ignavibacteriaceae bacterium]|nr:hypothetical protein [Ignavibacteriaceae bacterium]
TFPCYFAEQKSNRASAEITGVELEFLKIQRAQLKNQMEMFFELFLKAVENHARVFYNSILEDTIADKNESYRDVLELLEKSIAELLNNIPVIVKKHLDVIGLWAHKAEFSDNPLLFDSYIQFELPPLSIDKKVKEVLGYIASLLIKHKTIKLNDYNLWVLECGSNYILPVGDYNWSNEMMEIISVYEGSFKQLKIIDKKIDTLNFAVGASIA